MQTMPDHVFIDTYYTYRNWRYGLGIVAFGTFGGWLAYKIVQHVIHKPQPQGSEWAVFLFVTAITGFFLYTAGIMVWGVITNKRIAARIDSAGITMGTRHLPWDRVRFIAGMQTGKRGLMLKIGVRRSPDWHFWIGRPWTDEEYATLRAELDPFLAEAFPDIGLGA
jgi:hypothetical protein